ncbi:MAG: anthranilate synthase component I family protein [Planctomycetes bacterium]|nr:anthranilate synthase component I family protein [Planctomycetota bacterium]MCP4771830.1 anthranilate synthase component I family protein [Planctomycetota bacterium]MCP4860925.1 anthranilate synthase component I family protein [Planctomycetota bacterium]
MTTLQVRCIARSSQVPGPATCLQLLPRGCEPVLLDSSGDVGFSTLAWAPDQKLGGHLQPDPAASNDSPRSLADSDPAQLLEQACQGEQWIFEAGLPKAGIGWLGWFGFECGHAYESFPWNSAYPDGWPDFHFGRYRHAMVWMPDGEVLLLHAQVEGGVDDQAATIQQFENLIKANENRAAQSCNGPELQPEVAGPIFKKAVERLRHWIGEGELYQANLSHVLSGEFHGDARQLYQSLRTSQPTAMSAYWEDAEGRVLLSHSPERFLQVRGLELLSQPIKGTAPRGQDSAEDQTIAAGLAADEKEVAELTMIVDMARNDLGRVADVGAVQVDSAGDVEAFSTLFHRTATVRARWQPEIGLARLFAATFPPASITGAPKVRALNAISELEGRSRGPYCGCLGYWIPGDHPHGDFSVLIRTATLSNHQLRLAVGAGIVWDSDPQREWDETRLKGRYLTG